MEFRGKAAVVTGGGHGIGKCIAEEFEKQGAIVYIIDVNGIRSERYYIGDIGNKQVIEEFADFVVEMESQWIISFMVGKRQMSHL